MLLTQGGHQKKSEYASGEARGGLEALVVANRTPALAGNRRTQRGALRIVAGQDDDTRTDVYAVVEIFDVVVGQPYAARGHKAAYSRRLVGAVDPKTVLPR